MYHFYNMVYFVFEGFLFIIFKRVSILIARQLPLLKLYVYCSKHFYLDRIHLDDQCSKIMTLLVSPLRCQDFCHFDLESVYICYFTGWEQCGSLRSIACIPFWLSTVSCTMWVEYDVSWLLKYRKYNGTCISFEQWAILVNKSPCMLFFEKRQLLIPDRLQ